jgi:N-acetylmuramic acid 6-phosphate etherase
MTTEHVDDAAMLTGADDTHTTADDAGNAVVRVASPTERRNPRSTELDRMGTPELLRLINDEDRTVPDAVARVLDAVAAAVDLAVPSLRRGGRVHYFGAGTSGRMGVLDAAELPPTFSTPDDWFCPHLAGGPEAMWRAVEDAEDDDLAGAEHARSCVRAGDVVVGLAASGRTPYVVGALRTARLMGAHTVLVSGDPEAVLRREVDVFVGFDTGPEVITGSTRMKAATAQKFVLNAFSTAVMVRLGRVYSNLMVSLVATNAKLRGRMLSILVEATGHAEEVCQAALSDAGGDLKAALVALLSGTGVPEARAALARADDQVRGALALLAPA